MKAIAADLLGLSSDELNAHAESEALQEFAMTAKTKATSRILDAVHETARDLHAAGFIDKRRMREYDALCLTPIPEYSGEKIEKGKRGQIYFSFFRTATALGWRR